MKRQIIWASLMARPVRTTVSILAVTLEVTLILVIVGLTTGMSTETGRRIEGVGADIMFQPPNASILLALNNSTMPMAIGDRILADVEGVRAVAPVQTLVNSQGGIDVIYGIDPAQFDEVSGGFHWHSGRMFAEPYEAVVDDWFARAKNVKVGDEIVLLDHTFKVSGVVEHGKGARVFISLQTAQEMTGVLNRASLFYVKLDDPDHVGAVIERMDEVFPAYPARNMREFTSLMSGANMPGLDAFIRTVVVIAVSIGVLVIFLSMYTTITERTREIGILRSLGASKRFIVSLVFQESVLICILGVVLGVGVSLLISGLVQQVYPTLVVLITPDWILRAAIFAVVSGIIGSLYPSFKAATQDPVEALAYE